MSKQSWFMTEKLETANKQQKEIEKKSYMVLSKIIMLDTFYLFKHTQRHIHTYRDTHTDTYLHTFLPSANPLLI